MRVRNKNSGTEASSGRLNTHGLGEMIVQFDEGDASSEYISDYEVQLPDGSWKDLPQAFRDHDVITDNYDTVFFFPRNDEDRRRGFTL